MRLLNVHGLIRLLLRGAAEESLLLTADRVDATRTPEEHLLAGVALTPDVLTTPLIGDLAGSSVYRREVRSADLGHSADEGGLVVERLGTLESDSVLLSLLLELNVNFVERLDVVTGESDGHNNGILVTLLSPALDGIARLRSKPSSGTDLRLPGDSVWVTPLQASHDGSYGSSNLGGVRVTSTRDDLHG